MVAGPLVAGWIEAGQEMVHRFEAAAARPVTAAFWLRDGDADRWELYLASDRFNDGWIGTPDTAALHLVRDLADSYPDPFRVRLVGLHDPAVRAVLDYYRTHPPRIPRRVRGWEVGQPGADDVYLVKGPTGDYAMPSGREALDKIIDKEAAYFEEHGRAPRKLKLPVLLAYDLAKCGRDQIGDLSGRVFMNGIDVFEKEGFHGMAVEIVRQRDAKLELE